MCPSTTRRRRLRRPRVQEFGPAGVRAVTVSPDPARVRTAVREVAQPIAYLASPQAARITGADFLIDGGW
jgi:NAD(P)-dependent dehydrogenase (short-subunit alcohol dehydrogenase family)